MTDTNLILMLLPWVIFLPLIGLGMNLLFGRLWGHKITGFVASLATMLAFGVAVALTILLARYDGPWFRTLGEWVAVGNLRIDWTLRLDTLSATMMLVVTGVGTLIHIYATSYMLFDVRHNGDPRRYHRFFVFFNLFIVAMLLLVSADNYLVLFVGWEGVGLCSYLLIGFWFDKGQDGIANARAAKKAFIVNRIGDFGLLVALFILFWAFGTLQFDQVFYQAAAVAPGIILAVTLFMLLGVAGKSAQLPLFVWLPDAMAGPTPVSALIHAATMVTAGVYLVARSSALYMAAPLAQGVVTWVGAVTALFAATIAVGQFDIKKVLAYSTISQLGFMVAAVGMGAFTAGMFHLVTHAFFKALLFLAAGSVILGLERGHAAHHTTQHPYEDPAFDPQDMRNMGGLQRRMPVTFWVYLVGALALAGIAPLAGFFSKDEILAAAAQTSPAIFVVLVASAFLTAFYMGRQIFMVFFGRSRTSAAGRATESGALITMPLAILALLSLLGGVLNLPGVLTLEHWLEQSLHINLAAPFTWWVALLSLGAALLGLLLAWVVYCRRTLGEPQAPDPLARPLGFLFTGLQRKWWVDEFYHAIIVRPYAWLADVLAVPVDQMIIDGAANGLANLAGWMARQWSRWQNGYVRTYAMFVLVGVVAIMLFIVLR